MDEMEKSVGEKGQYFVKFGHKKDASLGRDSDTRALLLIKSAVDPKDNSNIFIAITREGAKGLRLIPQDKNPEDQDEQGEAKMKTIIQRKLETKRGESDPSAGFQDDGRLLLFHNGDGFRFPSENKDTEMRTVETETVKTAITESQRAAEIPHFLQLQREQQGLADAKGLLGVIKQLPPKQ